MRTAAPARSDETAPPRRRKAVAFGMDPESLADLRQALPGWRIHCFHGTTVGSMPHDWDPGEADLFVVCLRENVTEVLGLCRFLARWPSCESDPPEDLPETSRLDGKHEDATCRPDVPLLVLVSSGQDTLVGAALEVGARACLQQPISSEDMADFLNRAPMDNLSRRERKEGDLGVPGSH
jgi:CheY-like chemotaxis protein